MGKTSKEEIKPTVPQNYIRLCYQFEDSPNNRAVTRLLIEAIKRVSWQVEGRHQVLKSEIIQLSSFEMANTNPEKQKELQEFRERTVTANEILSGLKRPKKKGK